MPIYSFICKNCKFTQKKLISAKEAENLIDCAICNSKLSRILGIPSSLSRQTVDEYRGKQVEENIDDKIETRAHEHWVKHDLPRIIATEGKEYAVRQGFIDIEGNVIKGPHKTNK